MERTKLNPEDHHVSIPANPRQHIFDIQAELRTKNPSLYSRAGEHLGDRDWKAIIGKVNAGMDLITAVKQHLPAAEEQTKRRRQRT